MSLSILYLRCCKRRKRSRQQHHGLLEAFNSLFEMQLRELAGQGLRRERLLPFNSLFEMLTGTRHGVQMCTTTLSILYLRCCTAGRTRVLVKELSILYLRCATRLASVAPLCFFATFNSLFEMQSIGLCDASPRRLHRVLSILYLRCAKVVYVAKREVAYNTSFNSLFEMLAEVFAEERAWAEYAFNSLFEMLNPLQPQRGGRKKALSILYLRCHNCKRLRRVYIPVDLLSILYLRCWATS